MQTATIDTGEHRLHQRFPSWIKVTVADDAGRTGQATLVDVSASGALVAMPTGSTVSGEGRIWIDEGGVCRSLAYKMVDQTPCWEGTLVRLQFTHLSDEDVEHLVGVLANVSSDSTGMHRWIASGRGLLGQPQPATHRRLRLA
ncbi:MAG: PilZ domain-containing protein [Dehalococcoidia bacterium]